MLYFLWTGVHAFLIIDVVICFIGLLFKKVKQVPEGLLHVLHLEFVGSADEGEGQFRRWHVSQGVVEDNLANDLCEKFLVDWLEVLDQGHFADQVVDHGSLNVPLEDAQHDALHLEEIRLHVAFSTEADQFRHLGRVPLLVLGSDEKSGAAGQLKDVRLDGLGGQEPVQDAGGQDPRVEVETELLVHAEQPV